ncbi:MAG: hypothetical protein IJ661_09275 [Lachnospiraceae bacterium]|nr:hypothetical protein [Lachnospiraceae bacterium]
MENIEVLEWREAFEGEELAPGVGETQALSYLRGRLYRTYSLELIQNYLGDEPYQYIEQDYSKIQLP